jgi:glutathione S-transferase
MLCHTTNAQMQNAAIHNIIFNKTLATTLHNIITTVTLSRYDTGLKFQNKRIDRLEDILTKSKFLVEGEFSVADVAVASYLLYVIQFFPDVDLHSKWPNIVRYMKDCAGREGYGKAFGERVQSYCVARLGEMESSSGKEKKLFGMF